MATQPDLQFRKISLRKDTAQLWTQNNPLLLDGEVGIEKNTGQPTRLKIGDGVRRWNDLPYFGSGGSQTPGNATISTDPNNRLTTGTDGGLYVGDDDTDLVIHYNTSKS